MAKTLYEGYRVGKNGGERWVGTVQKDSNPRSAQVTEVSGQSHLTTRLKTPKGGSVIHISGSTKTSSTQ